MSSKMRVVILSDTHGTLDERIAREAVASDVVVHAGDVGSREVLEALTPRDGRLIAVRGNNDVREKWPSSDWKLLESLPWEAQVSLPGGELVVVHGHRYGYPGRNHARMRQDYPEARLVVYGHSHQKCTDRRGSPWILNPGAAGSVRTYGGPTFSLLVVTGDRWNLQTRRFRPLAKRSVGSVRRTASV